MGKPRMNGYERLRLKIALLQNQLITATAQQQFKMQYRAETNKHSIIHLPTGRVFEQVSTTDINREGIRE
jgi:hypothetical protein